jgi:GTP-binding protein HflX
VHVADASSSQLEEQVEAVRRVLDEIGAGALPEVLALNKIDRVAGGERARLARRFPGAVSVSALTGEGAEGLLEAIAEATPNPPIELEALVPWDRGDVVAMLYREAEVIKAEAEPEGTRVWARVGLRELAALRPFAVRGSTDPATRSATAPDRPTDP